MNEFIAALMENFSRVLGYNPYLIAGFAMFFIFGLIYALGLPRFLTIPMSVFAIFIIFGFGSGIGFLATLAVGLGLGMLLYIILR